MRLDKFLKDSRLVKRRTLAKQMCDAGKVLVNDKSAKASTEIAVDDTITIQYNTMCLKVQVESLRTGIDKSDAKKSYRELKRKVQRTSNKRGIIWE